MQTATLAQLLKVLGDQDENHIHEENRRELESKTSTISIGTTTFFHTEDPFDEQFFQLEVGKILDVLGDRPIPKKDLGGLERELPYVYTTARLSIAHMELIQSLLMRKWFLLDTTIDLVCRTADVATGSVDSTVETATLKDLPRLLECSRSFSYGRLFSDPLFSKGTNLYEKWIQNSFEGKVADSIFVMRSDNFSIDGFASIREHTISNLRYWEVPLVTKHPDSKKSGVAKTLLQVILQQAKKAKIACVLIGTHGENIAAQRSYIAAGFKPFDSGVTLRFYKPLLAKGT